MNPDFFIRSPLHQEFVGLLHHDDKKTLDWQAVFAELNKKTDIDLTEEECEIFSLLYKVFHYSMRGGKEVFIAEDRKDSNAQHCINTVLEANALFEQAGSKDVELHKEVYRKILLHDLGEFFREFSNNGAVAGHNLPKDQKDKIESLIANRIIPLAAQAVQRGEEAKAVFFEQYREMQANVNTLTPKKAAKLLKGHFQRQQDPDFASETVTTLLGYYNQVEGEDKKFADYLTKSIEKVQGQGWYLYHDLTSTPDFEAPEQAQQSKRYTRHAYAPSEVQVIIHRNAFRHLYHASKEAKTPEKKAIVAMHLDNVYAAVLQAVDLGTGRLSFAEPEQSLIVDNSMPGFAQQVIENHEKEATGLSEGEEFAATRVGLHALLSAMRELQIIPKGKHSPLEVLWDDTVEIYNLADELVERGDVLHEAAYHIKKSAGINAFVKEKERFVTGLKNARQITPYLPKAEVDDVNTTPPRKISFCTTVMNRGQHLKQSLPQNLANNSGDNVEFVILDYGDKEGIDGQSIKDWLLKNYSAEIESGRIRYGRTEQEHFKMAHAKNMAHRLATGDVVCNLDADNVTGVAFAEWLTQEFTQNENICVRRSPLNFLVARQLYGKPLQGVCGRFAISAENFHRVHGYDETMQAWGGDDEELEARAEAMGVKKLPMLPKHYGEVIQHSNEERTRNMTQGDADISNERLGHGKKEEPYSRWQARLKTLATIAGVYTDNPRRGYTEPVNSEGAFGCGEVMVLDKDLSNTPLTLAPKPHPLWSESLQSTRVRQYYDWRNPSVDGRSL